MAADTGRYNAWFYDPRFCKSYDMSMTLFFHSTEFCGMGKDEIGLFVVKNGLMNQQNRNISFLKKYQTHTVKYKGVLQSWKTPLKAEGTWQLSNYPTVTGKWGMALQGSPSHGALPDSDHPTRSKWEEWGHSILQWVPIPFVATAWDGGASLFYALTGNAKKAKERIFDTGVDAAFDLLYFISAGSSTLARGAEREAVRGGEVISRRSSTSTLNFNPIGEVEHVVERAPPQFQAVGRHGAAPSERGIIGVAGSYSSIARNSVRYLVEANHIPPSSATRRTIYEIGDHLLPALSTEYQLHQGLNRTFGTTAGSNEAREIRNGINRFLRAGDMPSALQIQILTDYAFWHGIERYEEGLRNLLEVHTRTLRTDGRPFLSITEYNSMCEWLTNQVMRFRQFRAQGRISEYEVILFDEILNLLNL
ncbi:hypothetical protein HOLleu_32611 [Holothuria leucospilota]|uniref:Uncharacterized protein n=1 Tax=Holothuria leucospilota TaxID=206669 RepID=A0A9Q1GVK3_HOLLE|nr:hypothetical protein HOLleu_32611 [Holothuria leucospilota]